MAAGEPGMRGMFLTNALENRIIPRKGVDEDGEYVGQHYARDDGEVETAAARAPSHRDLLTSVRFLK